MQRIYRQALFMEGSKPIMLQSGLGSLHHLWLDWYNLLRENAPKDNLFTWKIIHLIRVLAFS